MPLGSLKLSYDSMMNDLLRSIQIESIDDFGLVENALQSIIDGLMNSAPQTIPEKYQAKMLEINERLSSPELYVERRADDEEYRQLVKTNIASMIKWFHSLNESQKQEYIQRQQTERTQKAVNQQKMAESKPPQPGSDAHVLTEDEYLAESQRQLYPWPGAGGYAQITGSNTMSRFRPFMRHFRSSVVYPSTIGTVRRDNESPNVTTEIPAMHLDIVRREDSELETGQRNLVDQGQAVGLNESQLDAVRMCVIDKLSVVRAMLNRTFSMLDFKDLTTEQISNVGTIALHDPNCITALSDGRTTITQLADMDADSLRQAVESDNYPRLQLR